MRPRLATSHPAARRALIGLGLMAFLSGWPGSAQAATLEAALADARQLLQADRASTAYDTLRRLDDQHAGEVEYDYWLGVAALRAERPSEALLALQRAILNDPRHAGARLELVGAYLQLNRPGPAERELERLEALDPPPQARRAMRRFRAAIEQGHDPAPTHRVRLGVELGYDSNVQRYPSRFLIDPNDLLPDVLRPLVEPVDEIEIRRTGSPFQQVGAGYRGAFPLQGRHRLEVNTSLQSRLHGDSEATPYDITAVQGRLGWHQAFREARSLRLTLGALKAWHDSGFDALLTRWSLGAEYAHDLGDSRLIWHTRWQDNRFDATPRNDHLAGKAGIEMRLPREGWTLRLRGLVEREWEDGADPGRDGGDLDHTLVGIGADLPVGHRQLWRLDLDRRWRHYRDPGFATYNDFEPARREDDSWEVSLRWLYQWQDDWLIQARAEYEHLDSSLDFFQTERFQTRLGLHYLF